MPCSGTKKTIESAAACVPINAWFPKEKAGSALFVSTMEACCKPRIMVKSPPWRWIPLKKSPCIISNQEKTFYLWGPLDAIYHAAFVKIIRLLIFAAEVSIYLPNSWQQVSLHLTKAGTLALHLPITNRLYGSSMFLIQQKA
jgi:hypothetical protein